MGTRIAIDGSFPPLMIEDESELEEMTSCAPGTIAFTAGRKKAWQLAANGEWVYMLNTAAANVMDAKVAAEAAAEEAKAVQESIPEDYTQLSADVVALKKKSAIRVTSLDNTPLAVGTAIETVGIPVYVSDITDYSEYGLTDTGWYVFAKIAAPDGVTVSGSTSVTGAAGYIATDGETFVNVAVKFDVASQSKAVTVNWDGEEEETFVFKATDLAVRNLDYRTTFYIYDIAPYTTWTYALTTDEKFVANKNYYTLDITGVYVLATVTVGEDVPADTYYNHSKVHFEGMASNVTYRLDEMVDCPIEIALPEIADDGHGAWFEIQMRYSGSYSCTLLPPTGVKIGTATTQAQSAGMNTIDLQYTNVDNVKMWTLLNTHSNIPT